VRSRVVGDLTNDASNNSVHLTFVDFAIRGRDATFRGTREQLTVI